jgi:polar amino acid transport system permease protein
MNSNGDDAAKVVPVRHYGQWAASFAAVIVVAMLVHTLLSKIPSQTGQKTCHSVAGVRSCQPLLIWRFGWNIVGQYFFSSEILRGLVLTIELTLIAMTLGIFIGVLLAVMRLSSNRLLSTAAWTYTWFFRGTPVYVQIFFWYLIVDIYPKLTLGVPFTNITFVHLHVNSILTAFVSACIALGLNEGAYMSEIARSGLIAVDEGQTEAASSLGMTRGQTMRLVVLPQAMRVIIPPTGNELISMLKTTSLVGTAGVIELFGAQNNISSSNFETVQLLVLASVWYLIVTTILSIGQFYLERHFSRGALRIPPPTPIARLRSDIRGVASKFRTPRIAREVRA